MTEKYKLDEELRQHTAEKMQGFINSLDTKGELRAVADYLLLGIARNESRRAIDEAKANGLKIEEVIFAVAEREEYLRQVNEFRANRAVSPAHRRIEADLGGLIHHDLQKDSEFLTHGLFMVEERSKTVLGE